MNDLMKIIPIESWFPLNAKLQTKKNALRKKLKEKGILKREGNNTFSKYSYFSEAQYKQLFTELFSEAGLELKFNELEYLPFDGTEKNSNGRMVKIEFILYDVETGFGESTIITGEGMDTGDKAGYKAYTGGLKYYLADTFMVASGDDPETDSPEEKIIPKKASANQISMVKRLVADIPAMLNHYGIEKIEDLSIAQASEIIKKKGANK